MFQIPRVIRISLLLAPVLFFLPSTPASGQPAVLVRDLTEGSPDVSASSRPRGLAAVGSRVFFSAEVAGSGRELWASDGTETRILADLCPGSCDGSPEWLGAWRNVAFFDRSPLWRSDGTPAGTFSLNVDAWPPLVRFGGALWFTGCAPETGCEIWRTDGTRRGTRRRVDLVPGNGSGPASGLTVAGGRLYFFSRASGEQAVWRSDGTAAGTVLVAPVPGLKDYPPPPTAAGGRVFFFNRGFNRGEVWASDGTETGTGRVASFSGEQAFWSELLPGARGAYFAADDGEHGVEVWFSDGTESGTARVTDFAEPEPYLGRRIEPWMWADVKGRLVLLADGGTGPRLWLGGGRKPAAPLEGLTVSVLSGLVRLGSQVLFRADDGVHGYELWRTDGTAAGTALVLDLCPGVCDGQVTLPQPLSGSAAPQVAFLGWEPDHGVQVWTSDGTARGTRRRTSLPPGSFVADGFGAAAAGGRLFFSARDDHGEELWTAGGAAGGGQRVADLARRTTSSELSWLTPLGDRLVFAGPTRGRTGLWASGGTAESTAPLGVTIMVWDSEDIRPPLPVVGGKVFFRAEDDHGYQIWATDGTAAGSRPVSPRSTDQGKPSQTGWNGRAVFPVWAGNAVEIWTSDGTAAGTRSALTLPPDIELYSCFPAAFGQDLYVATRQGLFRSDGLTSGVTRLSTEPVFRSGSKPLVTQVGSQVFFLEDGLWRTDGTVPGTSRLDLPYDWGRRFWDLKPFGGSAVIAMDNDYGRSIARTDGTEAGTVVLSQFPVPYDVDNWPFEDPTPAWLVVMGGRLFFPGWDLGHGYELWTSDGTPEGTHLLLDLVPGIESSEPAWLTVAQGRLWFAATDRVHGRELWTSDGTAEGTRIVQDLAPGGLSSTPEQMTAGDGALWFVADDGLTGRELWRLPLEAPTPIAASDAPRSSDRGRGSSR